MFELPHVNWIAPIFLFSPHSDSGSHGAARIEDPCPQIRRLYAAVHVYTGRCTYRCNMKPYVCLSSGVSVVVLFYRAMVK